MYCLKMFLQIFLIINVLSFTLGTRFEQTLCPTPCTCKTESNEFVNNVKLICTELDMQYFPYLSQDGIVVVDVNISENRISEITIDTFEQYSKLKRITARYNEIETIETGSFYGLTDLEEVDLSKNFLSSIDKDTFSRNGHLTSLDLSGNPLQHFDSSPILASYTLKSLKLSFCKLTTITPEMLTEVPNLNTLDVRNNQIQNIPVEILKQMTDLDTFRVNNNPLECTCGHKYLIEWINFYTLDKNATPAFIKCEGVYGSSKKVQALARSPLAKCSGGSTTQTFQETTSELTDQPQRQTKVNWMTTTAHLLLNKEVLTVRANQPADAALETTTELTTTEEPLNTLFHFIQQNSTMVYIVFTFVCILMVVACMIICIKLCREVNIYQERKNGINPERFTWKRLSLRPFLDKLSHLKTSETAKILPSSSNEEHGQGHVYETIPYDNDFNYSRLQFH